MASELDDVQRLSRAGFTALRENRPDDALTIASQLKQHRFSACFEIEARARWAKGERNRAVQVLQEGVTQASAVPSLWHWLACYQSDQGQYDHALEAFARESLLSGSLTANSYNVAVVYERMGRLQDALDVLDQVECPDQCGPSPAHFAELRARLLLKCGRRVDALRIAEMAAALMQFDADNPIDPALHDRVLRNLREARADRSKATQQLVVIVESHKTGGEPHPTGFFRRFEVVADAVDEALGFIRPFITEQYRDALKISETKLVGPAPDQLKRVVRAGAAVWFDRDEDPRKV